MLCVVVHNVISLLRFKKACSHVVHLLFAQVAYGAQTNSSVIVRINEIPSIPGAKGSTLL